MQDRKRLEEAIQQDSQISAITSDIDTLFELGHTLKEASRAVPLNHAHCAKFCVLGGGSCS